MLGGARCKLDPGFFKSTRFQTLILKTDNSAFILNLVSQLAPLQLGLGEKREEVVEALRLLRAAVREVQVEHTRLTPPPARVESACVSNP